MKLTEQICPLSRETCKGELCPLYHYTMFVENEQLGLAINPTGEYCYLEKALAGIISLSISVSEGLEDIDETLSDISYRIRKDDEEYEA